MVAVFVAADHLVVGVAVADADGDELEAPVMLAGGGPADHHVHPITLRGEAGDVGPAAMAALIRQFRDVDAKIRGIDAAAEEAAAADDPDDDGGNEADWDPSKL